jgi:hypothetical protein
MDSQGRIFKTEGTENKEVRVFDRFFLRGLCALPGGKEMFCSNCHNCQAKGSTSISPQRLKGCQAPFAGQAGVVNILPDLPAPIPGAFLKRYPIPGSRGLNPVGRDRHHDCAEWSRLVYRQIKIGLTNHS